MNLKSNFISLLLLIVYIFMLGSYLFLNKWKKNVYILINNSTYWQLYGFLEWSFWKWNSFWEKVYILFLDFEKLGLVFKRSKSTYNAIRPVSLIRIYFIPSIKHKLQKLQSLLLIRSLITSISPLSHNN